MVVALGALWFASEGLRRMDAHNENLINAHIKSLRKAMGEYAKAVDTLGQRLQVIEKQMRIYKDGQARAKETLVALEKWTRNLQAAEPAAPGKRDVA